MKRTLVYLIFIVAGFSIAAIYILHSLATPSGLQTNGFVRKLKSHKTITGTDTFDLKYDSYYIAGKTAHQIFLANIVYPQQLIAVDASTLDTQRVHLNIRSSHDLTFWSIKVKVDSPYFYMLDGALPAIFKGDLKDNEAHLVGDKGAYFLDLEPMGIGSYAIRSLNSSREAMLGKLTYHPFQVSFHPNLLEKQLDGIFCTEGILQYDKTVDLLVYLYMYRNQYLVMDTSLNVLYRHNTIDTTSTAKIKVGTISSANARAFAAPPMIVNRLATLHWPWLLVNSALIADNEANDDFENSSVIDVYNLDERRYTYSFYVPHHEREKMRQFTLVGNKLVVLYKKSMIAFDIRRENFENKK